MYLVKNIPVRIKDTCFILVVTVGGWWALKKVTTAVSNQLKKKRAERALEKWDTTPKDVVILHTISRGKTAPHLSPFVMKLETFLRMANIRYEMDFDSPWSSKGKTPWITFNGQHIADSQVIIEFLIKEFHNPIKNLYSGEEKAVAHAVRIMMDEHFYWGLGLWRYVYSEGQGLSDIFAMSPKALKTFYKSANARVKTASWWQGVGRHETEQVIHFMKQDLQAVSLILGGKKFLLGNEPCQQDCALFGFLVQVLWAAPGSPYTNFVRDNLPNLKEYCISMKNTFWPDWDACLAQEQQIV